MGQIKMIHMCAHGEGNAERLHPSHLQFCRVHWMRGGRVCNCSLEAWERLIKTELLPLQCLDSQKWPPHITCIFLVQATNCSLLNRKGEEGLPFLLLPRQNIGRFCAAEMQPCPSQPPSPPSKCSCWQAKWSNISLSVPSSRHSCMHVEYCLFCREREGELQGSSVISLILAGQKFYILLIPLFLSHFQSIECLSICNNKRACWAAAKEQTTQGRFHHHGSIMGSPEASTWAHWDALRSCEGAVCPLVGVNRLWKTCLSLAFSLVGNLRQAPQLPVLAMETAAPSFVFRGFESICHL